MVMLRDAARQDSPSLQFMIYDGRIGFASYLTKGRIARHDSVLGQLRQVIDQSFRDSVREVRKTWIACNVNEGQDGYRIDRRPGTFCGYFLHLRDKAIPAPGNRLNVLMLTRMFAERVSQSGDISGDVSLFDGSVGPDEFHDLVLAENVPAVLHQHEKHVENLWPQWHNLAIAQQPPLARVHAEWAKLIRSSRLPEHHVWFREIQMPVFKVQPLGYRPRVSTASGSDRIMHLVHVSVPRAVATGSYIYFEGKYRRQSNVIARIRSLPLAVLTRGHKLNSNSFLRF